MLLAHLPHKGHLAHFPVCSRLKELEIYRTFGRFIEKTTSAWTASINTFKLDEWFLKYQTKEKKTEHLTSHPTKRRQRRKYGSQQWKWDVNIFALAQFCSVLLPSFHSPCHILLKLRSEWTVMDQRHQIKKVIALSRIDLFCVCCFVCIWISKLLSINYSIKSKALRNVYDGHDLNQNSK